MLGWTYTIYIYYLLSLFFFLFNINFTHGTAFGIRFLRNPEDRTAPNGDEVIFECEVNLEPDRLEWTFRPSNVSSSSSSRFKYVPNSGKHHHITNEQLLVSKLRVYVTNETIGEYRCVGWFGPVALTSISARLTLASIVIDDDAATAIQWKITPKNSILLRCGTVLSQPPAVWSFYHNGAKLKQDSLLATSGALALNAITANDAGNYTCSATNTVANTVVWLKRHIILNVETNIQARSAPYFIKDAVNRLTNKRIARVGEIIILECAGIGTPTPKAIWSSPDLGAKIYNNRTAVLAYGFKISNLQRNDAGTYICRLDNGVSPPLVHKMSLYVHEKPHITQGPVATLINESDKLELTINVTGTPRPNIFWLINGASIMHDNEVIISKTGLIIRRVQKRHAGVVQVFARNDLGEDTASTMLQVYPKQIKSDVSLDGQQQQGKQPNGKRRHGKNNNRMIPPTAPNVTRLSDESVMLRWQVPRNNGLSIQFFKVQYRMLRDSTSGKSHENWQTTNEDIPYGKWNSNTEVGRIFTSSVTGLKPERYYRFRIIAVYINDDNKESNVSIKFFLQRGTTLGLTEAHLPVPELIDIEAYSETEVLLHWKLMKNEIIETLEGFYAYYRPAASAGEYFKATIEDAQTRNFKLGALEPGTIYEFKLQSFNSNSASEFSILKQGRTLKPIVQTEAPTEKQNNNNSTPQSSRDDVNAYLYFAGVAIAGIASLLVVIILLCLCIRRCCKTSETHTHPDEDKPSQQNVIQSDFVPLGSFGTQKTCQRHIVSGVRTPHMHITLNPLAQHEEKLSTNNQQAENFILRQTSNHTNYDSNDTNYTNGRNNSNSSTRRTQRSMERVGSVGGGGGVGAGGNNNNHAYDAPHPAKARVRLSSRSDTLSSASLNSVGV